MYIFQPARQELYEQIQTYGPKLAGKVLDAGAGPSLRYRGLLTSATSYETLDARAHEHINHVGSVDAIPLPDASFDGILCTQVIGDVYDVRKVFSEFYRVLTPGGRALLTEGFFDSLHDEPRDHWRFTANSLRKLAEDAGFIVEVLEPRGGYWSVRAQMTIRYIIERTNAYKHWYRRLVNIFARVYGSWMLWLDKRDKSNASHMFTHGFVLLVRKP